MTMKLKFPTLEERWAEEAKGPPILQVEGEVRDEDYILDICDRLLEMKAERQHRFDFLVGLPSLKTGKVFRLPVDAFYSAKKPSSNITNASTAKMSRFSTSAPRLAVWDAANNGSCMTSAAPIAPGSRIPASGVGLHKV